jgi:O-antigen ligase
VRVFAKESMPAPGATLWRDPVAWSRTSDVFAILIAASLPWSTTLVAIFAVAFLVSMGPFLDAKALLQSLKRPICALPIALFVLAAVGMLWSDAPWGARLHAVGPTAKLLMLPLLLYHFERSAGGMKVLAGFLISCVALMLMSWIVAFDPRLALKSDAAYGVPVKNYIDQSQEFALCAVVLAYPVITLWRAQKPWLATVRQRVADGACNDAGHAGSVRAASPEVAERRSRCLRHGCFERLGLGDVVQIARDRGKIFERLPALS